jgi:hypothetical protein
VVKEHYGEEEKDAEKAKEHYAEQDHDQRKENGDTTLPPTTRYGAGNQHSGETIMRTQHASQREEARTREQHKSRQEKARA